MIILKIKTTYLFDVSNVCSSVLNRFSNALTINPTMYYEFKVFSTIRASIFYVKSTKF